jgi:glycosyltransferase involved in cell wall biosynthesis
MRKLLSTASAVIMNTPEAGLRLARYFPELADRTVVIPNGFDSDDFANSSPSDESPGTFKIVHSGYLYTEVGLRVRRTAALRRRLGGFWMPVDLLPRSHAFLVEALDGLLERRPDLAGRFELHLAGSLSPSDVRVNGRRPYIRPHGYVAHDEAVRLVLSADLLFLPMHDIPEGERAGIVPGKTYEYLGSGRPILAAVPEGDAADILRQIPDAIVCPPKDVAALSAAIEHAIDSKQSSGTQVRDDAATELVARFERRYLTSQLADVFVDVADRDASRTGGAAPILLPARAR